MIVTSSRSSINIRHLEKATVSTGKEGILSEGNNAYNWSRYFSLGSYFSGNFVYSPFTGPSHLLKAMICRQMECYGNETCSLLLPVDLINTQLLTRFC